MQHEHKDRILSHLEVVVKNMELIKNNLPKYQSHPEVAQAIKKKQAALENDFLDTLQQVRRQKNYQQTYTIYANWYKHYKNIEEL